MRFARSLGMTGKEEGEGKGNAGKGMERTEPVVQASGVWIWATVYSHFLWGSVAQTTTRV